MDSTVWQVRPSQLSDADPLAAIATAVSQSIPIRNPSQFDRLLKITDGRFWTLMHREEVAGYAILLPLPGLPGLVQLEGSISPQFQRQGGGSFLWRQMLQEVKGTAVQQITHMVSDLERPAARFLQHHHFALEHEEWLMELSDLYPSVVPKISSKAELQQVNRQTALNSFPALYKRCFAGKPWFQPYTAAEVDADWQPNDQLYYLVANNQEIGFVWLQFPEPKQAEIEPIGIVKEKHGMGYGRYLLTTTLNHLHAQGCEKVSLGVWANNETAVYLYQSAGFRYSSSHYTLSYTLGKR